MDPFETKQGDIAAAADRSRDVGRTGPARQGWLDVFEQLANRREPADGSQSSGSESPLAPTDPFAPLPHDPFAEPPRPELSQAPGKDNGGANSGAPGSSTGRSTGSAPLAPTNTPIEPGGPPSGLRGGLRNYVGLLLLLLVGVGLFHQLKPLPEGTHLEGAVHQVDAAGVEFLYDLTYRDRDGQRVVEQRIFDRLFQLIDRADSFLIIDMFLFNRFAGDPETAQRSLTHELTESLLKRRREASDLPILLITDPINTVYGSEIAPHLERLREARVAVVTTDLRPLRDSNPVYSSLWRVLFQWFGNDAGGGDLVNPFDPQDQTTLRSYLSVANFKANHRKVVIAGSSDRSVRALVTSANPHDGSSAHSNVAFVVEGPPAIDLARSELAIAGFSGWDGDAELVTRVDAAASYQTAGRETLEVEALTEGGVRDRLIDDIAATTAGDSIDGAMFYLSHRGVIDALVAAAERGVQVRLILDANRDAFGREKNGIPNRPVANELRDRTGGAIGVRWYETHGEQFHSKMVVIHHGDEAIIGLGSSNLTRRNLDDYNLEATVRVVAPVGSSLALVVDDYFDRLWSNRGGALYTVDYQAYADPAIQRYWTYRIMEATGLSSF